MQSPFDEIYDYVKSIPIIDTHEHLPKSEADRDLSVDVLGEYLLHYFSSDLLSSGLSRQALAVARDPSVPLPERWYLIAPYWNACAHTGYARSITRSVSDLYGIGSVNENTIEDLNAAFLSARKPGNFWHVLKDKCNIIVSLLDQALDCDRTFFRSVFRIQHYVFPTSYSDIEKAEADLGRTVCCFEDFLEACDKAISSAVSSGAVAFKLALAYNRSLLFDAVGPGQAQEEFDRFFALKFQPEWEKRPIGRCPALQSFMVHFIFQRLNRLGLPAQIHTGLQEGSGNILPNSNPALLCNLFSRYPDVKFDLFHIGYPYQNELGALAKTYPNVFIDMCWAHIISPGACVAAMCEWLDTVPLNKISAFGGDYRFVDGVYGHQFIARKNVSKALSIKVEEGIFSTDRAMEIARMWFADNPKTLFNLTIPE